MCGAVDELLVGLRDGLVGSIHKRGTRSMTYHMDQHKCDSHVDAAALDDRVLLRRVDVGFGDVHEAGHDNGRALHR